MTDMTKLELDDVLDLMLAQYGEPSEAALSDFGARFPLHARDLLEFAATWAEQAHLPVPPPLNEQQRMAVASRAASYLGNLLHQRDSAQATSTSAVTLASLASQAGSGLQAVAQACDLDLPLVSKLNSRRILSETIPQRLSARIAEFLGLPVERVLAAWSGPPRLAASAAFLAKTKPQAGAAESFADAIEASGLERSQKDHWLRGG